MELFGIVLVPAFVIRRRIVTKSFKTPELGLQLVGIYNARVFGLCVSRRRYERFKDVTLDCIAIDAINEQRQYLEAMEKRLDRYDENALTQLNSIASRLNMLSLLEQKIIGK